METILGHILNNYFCHHDKKCLASPLKEINIYQDLKPVSFILETFLGSPVPCYRQVEMD